MKKYLSLLLAAGLFCSAMLTGCAGTAKDSSDATSTAGDSAVAAIKAAGKVVMYTNAAFPPFEYMQGEKVVGVDADIAAEIAAELGVELEIMNVEFDTIITSIQSGKGDFGAAGMTIKPERLEAVDFSISYITSKQYIITKSDSTVAKIEDLAGMKIGVQAGTTGYYIIKDEIDGTTDDAGAAVKGVLQDTDAKVETFDNAIDATLALTTGKLDAVIIDKLPAENLVAANTGLKTIELVYADGSNTEEEYAICVQKGSDLVDVINTVLQRLIDEGKIGEYVITHTNKATITE